MGDILYFTTYKGYLEGEKGDKKGVYKGNKKGGYKTNEFEKKFRGKLWNNLDEMVEDIENTSDYEVLNYGEYSITVIDRTESDNIVDTYELHTEGEN